MGYIYTFNLTEGNQFSVITFESLSIKSIYWSYFNPELINSESIPESKIIFNIIFKYIL